MGWYAEFFEHIHVQLPQPSIAVDQAVAYPEMFVRQDD